MTSQVLSWRTHFCVQSQLDASAGLRQRASAGVPTRQARVLAPHLPAAQCKVIRAPSLRRSVAGRESDADYPANGAAVGDVFRAPILDELEILDEARGQSAVLAVVGLAARPTAGRVENLRRNALEFDRDIETEDGVGAVRHGF